MIASIACQSVYTPRRSFRLYGTRISRKYNDVDYTNYYNKNTKKNGNK